MAARKIIGVLFSLIAILFSTIFVLQSNLGFDLEGYFDFSLKSYFSLAYLREITPLIVNLILLYGGILLLIKPSKSNQVLALFGFTVLEEIAFNWLGIFPLDLPLYVVAVFLCCSLLALWVAYSNRINLKRLSFKEGVSGLILGTLINAVSYYF
ncbi:MAG: hypothetical protein ACJA0J_002607 [Bdellovibrionota bacterium]|jgi:hypothetical protein